jgi:hypothetical protein
LAVKQTLLEPLQDPLADETRLEISDDYITELSNLRQTVVDSRQELAQRRATLDAILAILRHVEPGSEALSLQDALQKHRDQQARRWADIIDQATKRVDEEYARTLEEDAARRRRELVEARERDNQRLHDLEMELRQTNADISESAIKDAFADARREQEQR